MSPLVRWLRFNLVGAVGAGVQLSAIHVLCGWFPRHVAAATIAAVEIALLHNFCWHVWFTWRGQAIEISRLRQLLRFQLSNGVVSFAGDTFITWGLIARAGLSPVLSNLFAIVSCSAVNFLLSEVWAFRRCTEC